MKRASKSRKNERAELVEVRTGERLLCSDGVGEGEASGEGGKERRRIGAAGIDRCITSRQIYSLHNLTLLKD